MKGSQNRSYNVPSVSKVDDILSYLADRGSSTFTEIYVSLGFPKSSTYKLLSSLCSLGYVRYAESSQTYQLGLKLLELGSKASNQIDITSIATPILKDLSLRINRVCHLGVLDGHEVVYVVKTNISDLIRIDTWVGRRIGAHCTAMGKVLLAWKKEQELDTFINKMDMVSMTPNTITDRKKLKNALVEVKKNGWSLDDEESTKMVRAVGAPIRDQSGQVCAALSICTLTQVDNLVQLLELKDTAIEAADKISNELGWARRI